MSIKTGVAISILILITIIGCGTEKERNPVLDIKPGKYKITVVRDNHDGQEPEVTVIEKCVSVEQYQPFSENYESEFCAVTNFERIGTSVKYDIECNKDLRTGMKGTVSYGYMDERLRWSNSSIGTTDGRIYSFKIDGEALLIGECEEAEEKIKVF